MNRGLVLACSVFVVIAALCLRIGQLQKENKDLREQLADASLPESPISGEGHSSPSQANELENVDPIENGSSMTEPNVIDPVDPAEVIAEVEALYASGLGPQHPAVGKAAAKLASCSEVLFETLAGIENEATRALLTKAAVDVLMQHYSATEIIDFIQNHIPAGDQSGILWGIMRNWTKQEPGAAAAWFLNHELDESPLLGQQKQRNAFTEVILSRLRNTGGAVEFWSGLQDAERQRQSVKTLFGSIDELPELASQIRESADPKSTLIAYKEIGTYFGKMELEQAREWAVGQVADEVRLAAAHGVAASWMRAEPEAAADWWLAQSTDDDRSNTYAKIIAEWATNSPNQAGTWLSNQPQTTTLDSARAQFATAVRERDPESAIAWAKSITDSKLRERVVLSLNESP
jgi:hypothetical protein